MGKSYCLEDKLTPKLHETFDISTGVIRYTLRTNKLWMGDEDLSKRDWYASLLSIGHIGLISEIGTYLYLYS